MERPLIRAAAMITADTLLLCGVGKCIPPAAILCCHAAPEEQEETPAETDSDGEDG